MRIRLNGIAFINRKRCYAFGVGTRNFRDSLRRELGAL